MSLYPALLAFGLNGVPDTPERRLPSGTVVRVDRRPVRPRRGPRV